MIKFQALKSVSRRNWLDLFIGATFLSAVFQDTVMVMAGIYNKLPFGFHQNVESNPFLPLYVLKVAKYLFSISALCIAWRFFPTNPPIKVLSATIFLLFPSILVVAFNQSYELILLGIKAWIPVFGYFIGLKIDTTGYTRLVNLIKISLLINLSIAAYQEYFYIQHLSFNDFGFETIFRIIKNIRVGGVFLEPNTFGLYGVICMLTLIIGSRINTTKANLLYCSLAYLLIIMSVSRTALVAATFVIGIFLIVPKIKQNKNPTPFLLVMVFLLLILFLMIFARGLESILIRFRDFQDLLLQDNLVVNLFGRGFGTGTISSATYDHVVNGYASPMINVDSQWISIYIQGGFWLLLTLSIFLTYIFFVVASYEIKVIMIVAAIVGCNTQFIEAWPFSFILFMLMGFCKQRASQTCL